MRDDYDGFLVCQIMNGVHDRRLGNGVEGARRFVEDEDFRVVVDGACDPDALTLAAGEPNTALSYEGLVALRELGGYKIVEIRHPCGTLDGRDVDLFLGIPNAMFRASELSLR